MLRECKTGAFTRHRTVLGARYAFEAGGAATREWGGRRQRALLAAQAVEPVAVLEDGRRTYWLFEGRVWWEDDGLDAEDVLALVRQRERRRDRQLASARAALAAGDADRRRREPIPRAVRRAVWERDGGRCAECAETFDLQYDHVIPLSAGGATTVANLQILCGDCNRAKGAGVA